MCGILGYSSDKKPSAEFLSGFEKLFVLTQTRGEHASGLAWASAGRLKYDKAPFPASLYVKGKAFKALKAEAPRQAVAHCRYATHGDPKDNANNHPFVSVDGNLAMVHNGVIRNHDEVGIRFGLNHGQCDSEVIVRLIERRLKGATEGAIREAVKGAAKQLLGSATFAVLSASTGTIHVVSHWNPLHLASIDGAVVFASEAEAIWEAFGSKTTVYSLPDGDGLVLSGSNVGKFKAEFKKFELPKPTAPMSSEERWWMLGAEA